MKLPRWINPFISGRRFIVFAMALLFIVSIAGPLLQNVSAARFTQRSLTIDNSSSAGRYVTSFNITVSNNVGSIKIDASSTPLDLREAVVTSQTGETGFAVNMQQANKTVILSRKPVPAGTQTNTYILDGLINNSSSTSFGITVSVYPTRDASGGALQSFPATLTQVADTYTVKFGFPGTTSVGAIRMEFCDDPVPYLPCTPVTGLDVSAATLFSQAGETGFSITNQTANDLILSRTPSVTGTQVNTYVLDNVQGPTVATTFYIRLTSYSMSNPDPEGDRSNYVDYGGVANASTNNIGIQTQVAPELVFCLSASVPNYNCVNLEGGNFVDLGELDSDQTYSTQTQLLARTNIADGYSISIHGIGVTSGNKTIPSLTVPTPSATGNSQFGINLVANNSPSIGDYQNGPGPSALINPDYLVADQFVYRNGETIISTNSVSDFKRYTISYILNRSPDQAPGVYATTLTYICSGNF